MKSAPITLTSNGIGVSEALVATEQIGKDCKLDAKSVLHLRLLAEELFGMLRGIAGEIKADYWVEYQGKAMELHLKSDIDVTLEMKEQLLAASSSGKNAAAKSFMGKIRVMIAGFLLSAKEVVPAAMVSTASASPVGGGVAAGDWSMMDYKAELQRRKEQGADALDDWDELEKSIVANIADDVKVKIVGKTVEIIVSKAF